MMHTLKTYWGTSVILAIVLAVSTSCSKKEDTFTIRVTNHTQYHINEFDFDGERFELIPNGGSALFNRELLTDCACATQPLTSLGVNKFSDSTQTYTHLTGQVLGASDFSSDKIIFINIHLKDSIDFPSNIFDIDYEQP